MEVWRSGEGETEQERFTDRLPLRFRGDAVGEIDLEEVVRRT